MDYHSDHLGSSRLMTNAQGTVVAGSQSSFVPYGYEYNPQSYDNHYKFTGLERDEETGAGNELDHAWFRQYSPRIGRWMSPDPAGLAAVDMTNPQTWNRYAYVMGNPANLIDPLGLDPITVRTTINVFGGSAPFVDLLSSGLGWESQSGGIGLGGSSGPTGSMHPPELTVESDSSGGTGDTSPGNNTPQPCPKGFGGAWALARRVSSES